tara:strand:- start:432 stop:1247 length:816 start_codon:yes stop_codon:yes gene_type:complete
MLSQSFIINLGLTLLIGSLLFLYFRRRLTGLEFKVNTLFTLIQEHNAAQNSQQINMYPTPSQENGSQLSEENLNQHNNMMVDKNELIEVSEDESETESESESESESETESESERENESNNIKSISINNNEVENDIINVDVEKLESFETQFTQPFNNLDKQDSENILELLEEVNVETDTNEFSGNNQSTIEKQHMDEEQVESDFSISEPSDSELSEDEHEEQIIPPIENMINSVNYTKLTVPKLKELVLERNLRTTVRKLKKGELIEILQTA